AWSRSVPRSSRRRTHHSRARVSWRRLCRPSRRNFSEMTTFGRALLIIALLTAGYAAFAALRAARGGGQEWAVSARRAIYALAAVLTAAVIVLEAACLRSDFSFGLVADNSSTTTPTFYRLTAMWSSQSGSLLLWVWVLSLFSTAALIATRKRHREILPYATAVLGGIATLFAAL